MIHNKKDWPATLFVALFCSLQFLLFFLAESATLVIAGSVCLMPLQGAAIACSHNQQHRNFFSTTWLNRCFEMALYFQTGTSSYTWTLHHVIGHHKNYLNPAKDPSSWQFADGTAMNRWQYCLYNTLMIYPGAYKVGKSHTRILKRFLTWLVISKLILLSLIIINPFNALIVFVIPMLLALLWLVDTTYDHHANLDISSEYTATHNCLNPLYNIFTCNLGYHTAHHMKPSIHWSELPELHETIKHQIPDDQIDNRWIIPMVFFNIKLSWFGQRWWPIPIKKTY